MIEKQIQLAIKVEFNIERKWERLSTLLFYSSTIP